MEFISELDLADFEDDETTHESRVGILIGVDYYFNIFLGKILKNSEGVVASSTVRGWVLSRPITLGNSSFPSVCFESHSMPCNVENNRVVSIRNIIDKNSWYHISGVNNPADIPTRVCKINDFERWFNNPQLLHADIEVSKFDTGERLKLVEAVVQTKGGKKDFKGVNSVNVLCSDFFDGAGHIVLDVDKDFKEGSDVVFDVAAEHVNNLSIALNSQTTNDVKVTETI